MAIGVDGMDLMLERDSTIRVIKYAILQKAATIAEEHRKDLAGKIVNTLIKSFKG